MEGENAGILLLLHLSALYVMFVIISYKESAISGTINHNEGNVAGFGPQTAAAQAPGATRVPVRTSRRVLQGSQGTVQCRSDIAQNCTKFLIACVAVLFVWVPCGSRAEFVWVPCGVRVGPVRSWCGSRAVLVWVPCGVRVGPVLSLCGYRAVFV